MSRIGKQLIEIPTEVTVELTNGLLKVKGPRGEISREVPSCLNVTYKEENKLQISRASEERKPREMHGLFRSLVFNMITGSSKGFTKILELKGVGYKASINGKTLVLSLGYSHPVKIETPEEIKISIENNTLIKLTGINKEKVGLLSQQIRSARPPEPYKGKGVLYQGEIIQRKAGKSSK